MKTTVTISKVVKTQVSPNASESKTDGDNSKEIPFIDDVKSPEAETKKIARNGRKHEV